MAPRRTILRGPQACRSPLNAPHVAAPAPQEYHRSKGQKTNGAGLRNNNPDRGQAADRVNHGSETDVAATSIALRIHLDNVLTVVKRGYLDSQRS